MTDTQKPAPKGSNGTGIRVTATTVEKGSDRTTDAGISGNNNSHNGGTKPTTPQKATSIGNNNNENSESNGKNGSAVKNGKKRRKVNHACIYCRRSHMTCDLERPCTRCIKRNIGHLCHDEPREPAKKSKSEQMVSALGAENEPPSKVDPAGENGSLALSRQQDAAAALSMDPLSQNDRGSTASLIQPTPVAAAQASSVTSNTQPLLAGFQDANSWTPGFGSGAGAGSFLHDMHSFHPQYSFGTSEVSNEYNLLNDFLTNSMLEDGGMYSTEDQHSLFHHESFPNTMHTLNNSLYVPNVQPSQSNQMLPPSQAAVGNAISRPNSSFPLDKAREAFYMTAADPAGNESPAERLKKLFHAKYDAGLLKPFNYVKGYARLNEYMATHLQPVQRQRILRQLEKFRPKFRERMHGLTDMQLVNVEMQFESRLMEYDRVFASMAIPACCWRRTGEIYRGNNEMAKLLGVPIEMLRDGKMAIHEIFDPTSLVSYWEKLVAIAFDATQKAILTSCTLRTHVKDAGETREIRCCFSFTIRRDTHHIPSLIVGNFLPICDP